MKNKITDYNNILKELEDKILRINDNEQKKLLIEMYIKITKELSKIEKKDLRYYKSKLESLKIEESVLENAIEEIKKNIVPKEIYNIERNLYLKLVEDFKNPNELLINTWINNYKSFLNKHNEKIKGVYDEKTISEYIRKLDKTGLYISKFLDENSETEKLSITNISTSFIKKNNKNNNLLALLNNAKKVPSKIIAYLISSTYKDKNITNRKLMSYMLKNGYLINEEGELIKFDGTLITKEGIEKERTYYLKQALNKDNEGEIPKDYKNNRIKTMLLNMDLVRTLRERKKIVSFHNKNNEDNLDMYKGLGKC